jgi:hypothetical protein
MQYPITMTGGGHSIMPGNGGVFMPGKGKTTPGEFRRVDNHGPMVANDRMIIRLCFYEPRAADEAWINKVVAFFSKNYVSHVEILFEDNMAASIFAGDVVFWRKRSYSNPNYKLKSFDVATNSYWLMYEHAKNAASRNIGFSNTKMFCGPLIGYRGSSDSTFCSEFVTQTLQVGGVSFAMKMNATTSTPSTLLDFMNTHSNICFDSTSFKLDLAFG